MLRRARAGWRSRCSSGIARLLRANSIVGPSPGSPAGGCGARAGAAAMPGVRPGAGPKGSVWMRAASIPSAARPALISSMNGIGPQRYASASRGGASSTSSAAVRRPVCVEVPAFAVVGAGAAVADVGVHVRERCEERSDLGREGLLAAAARAVQPPDLPLGVLLGERVEHREHRSGADARADRAARAPRWRRG